MSRKYKFVDNNELYFISFAVINWIDLFIRKEYSEIVLDSWKYCQREKDLEIYGWCIMTSHVHMIVGSKGRELRKIVGEMKSFTSTKLRAAISKNAFESRKLWILEMLHQAGESNSNNQGWQLWQQHNKPIALLTHDIFYQKLEYIHLNPVVAGFVEREENYAYSSAIDFYDGKGKIELSYIL